MTLPNAIIHVEWRAARRHDTPLDRRLHERNFTSYETAAAQVASLQRWLPTHAELLGIWQCTSYADGKLGWTAMTAEELLLALRPEDRERVDQAARAVRADDAIPR